MYRIKIFLNNLSLYRKIILVITICIICIYSVFFLSIRYLIKDYDRTIYQTNASLLNHVSTSIESSMNAVETISSNILTDTVIQEGLSAFCNSPKDNRTALIRRSLYNALNSYTFYNKYIESVTLLFSNEDYICVGSSSDLVEFDLNHIRNLYKKAQGKVIWSPKEHSGNQMACSRQIRQLKYLSLDDLATLCIVIDMESMISDALHSGGYSPDSSHFILFAGDTRIYPKNPYYDALCIDLIHSVHDKTDKQTENYYEIISLDDEKKFIIEGKIPEQDWNYLYFRDYDTIFSQIQRTKFTTFSISLLCCIAALLVIRIIIGRILRHIQFLVQKIRCFGRGETIPKNTCSYDHRFDEIGQLHQSFDQMTHSIKILRDENYDKQILLKDTTIKMLQQQINPHFLYNTLDTMNWLAQKCGSEEISTLANSLGCLFRSSISDQRDLIPLSEELSILDNYISIQEIRFQNRMTFHLLVSDHLRNVPVPKLCIQPLVENALKYSVEYTDQPCIIQVTIREYENDCLIEVANTGSQFEEDILNRIRNHEIIPHGSGIGLDNIDSRLKLLYGSHYGLHISNKDHMATVTLKIPKEKEAL